MNLGILQPLILCVFLLVPKVLFLECFVEDLFLGGQWSIILGYRRLSVKSLLVWSLIFSHSYYFFLFFLLTFFIVVSSFFLQDYISFILFISYRRLSVKSLLVWSLIFSHSYYFFLFNYYSLDQACDSISFQFSFSLTALWQHFLGNSCPLFLWQLLDFLLFQRCGLPKRDLGSG